MRCVGFLALRRPWDVHLKVLEIDEETYRRWEGSSSISQQTSELKCQTQRSCCVVCRVHRLFICCHDSLLLRGVFAFSHVVILNSIHVLLYLEVSQNNKTEKSHIKQNSHSLNVPLFGLAVSHPNVFTTHCVLATAGAPYYFFGFNIPRVNIRSVI